MRAVSTTRGPPRTEVDLRGSLIVTGRARVAGLAPGDRVAMLLPGSAAYVDVVIALLRSPARVDSAGTA